MQPDDPVLSRGEWAALLYATAGGQVEKLALRLAVHHGHVEPDPQRSPCPLCGKAEPASLKSNEM